MLHRCRWIQLHRISPSSLVLSGRQISLPWADLDARDIGPLGLHLSAAVFSFLYLKKIKISKLYVRFGKFQKYTPVALWGATGPKFNFFLQICNEVPGRGRARARGACRPLNGRQGGLSPPPSGDRWASPTGATGGPVAPTSGDRVLPPYISILPPFPPHLSPKIPPKI